MLCVGGVLELDENEKKKPTESVSALVVPARVCPYILSPSCSFVRWGFSLARYAFVDHLFGMLLTRFSDDDECLLFLTFCGRFSTV